MSQSCDLPERCHGCGRIKDGRCTVYQYPAARWRVGGGCPMATHWSCRSSSETTPVKINPLKASKRARRGRK